MLLKNLIQKERYKLQLKRRRKRIDLLQDDKLSLMIIELNDSKKSFSEQGSLAGLFDNITKDVTYI